MPSYVALMLLLLFAAGAYFCLRSGKKQRKRLMWALGAAFAILALLSFGYLLLTVLFVAAV